MKRLGTSNIQKVFTGRSIPERLRARSVKEGGGARLGKEVCKVDAAGLEVDVLRETRRRGF